jgi:hypothetical protein
MGTLEEGRMSASLLGKILGFLTGGEGRFMLQVDRYRPSDSLDGREHAAVYMQAWEMWAYAYVPREGVDYREVFEKLIGSGIPHVELIIVFKKSDLGNQVERVCFLIPENPNGSPRNLADYGLEPVSDEDWLLHTIGLPEPEVQI